MSAAWLAFSVGMFLGFVVGVSVICVFVAARTDLW